MDSAANCQVLGKFIDGELVMTKNNYDTPQTKYTSLSEIRERKQALLDNIRNDDSQMKALWDQLFGTSPSSLTTNLPSKRFSGLLNTGAGVLVPSVGAGTFPVTPVLVNVGGSI